MDNNSKSLAPSKSTVYVSNFSFSLTNNDIHKVFEKVGRIVKVTIVKDRVTRLSKGFAFVLFGDKETALKCVEQFNGTEIFGRQINCSIAKDNERAAEFIRKRKYPDKSRCYECGEQGQHLSYACPKNLLGKRDPPKSRKRKSRSNTDKIYGNINSKTKKNELNEDDEEEEAAETGDSGGGNSSSEENTADEDSLSAAIKFQQFKVEEDDYRFKVASGDYNSTMPCTSKKKLRIVKDAYFSDEEELVKEDD